MSIEGAAEHRFMNPLCSFSGPNKEHSQQIGVGFVTVKGGSWVKVSDFGRSQQGLELVFNEKNITVSNQQQ